MPACLIPPAEVLADDLPERGQPFRELILQTEIVRMRLRQALAELQAFLEGVLPLLVPPEPEAHFADRLRGPGEVLEDPVVVGMSSGQALAELQGLAEL